MESQRLGKRLAEAGIASRRKAEELIFEGHVCVNGEIVLKPETHVTHKDRIEVDGVPIRSAESKVYYVLTNPGVISAPARVKNLF